ncbi:MAG: helix-turn-helix domain-containing protein, partial [Actinomycetota bacterium]|nr:helix-turn-helix domain-containing protein [Actinomycetota bacterium]
RRVRVARNTLDRWIRTYRAGGFEALAPNLRNCQPVTPLAQLEHRRWHAGFHPSSCCVSPSCSSSAAVNKGEAQ